MFDYVNNNPIDKWAYRFLRDIKFVHQKKKLMFGNIGRQLMNNKLIMQRKKDLLSNRDFLKAFRASKSRLIIILLERIRDYFIDHGYNSVHSDDQSDDEEGVEMSDEIIQLINTMSKDLNTKIWVISADDRQKVHDTFAKVKNMGLGAEDGYFYRWDSQGEKTRDDWTRLLREHD